MVQCIHLTLFDITHIHSPSFQDYLSIGGIMELEHLFEFGDIRFSHPKCSVILDHSQILDWSFSWFYAFFFIVVEISSIRSQWLQMAVIIYVAEY